MVNDKLSFRSLFDPQKLGASLKEVASEVIQTESQDVTSRWFHSDWGCDLFLWFDERRNIIKQQVSFCGQIVEWNVVEGVKTGYILENEDALDPNKNASQVIRFDETPVKTSISQALDLIGYSYALNEIERQIVKKNFVESPRISTMLPQDFIDFYGPHQKASAPRRWIVLRYYWRRLIYFMKWLTR